MPRPAPLRPFRERRRAPVVLDAGGKAEPLRRPRDQIDVVEREVHRVQDAPGSALEVRRDAVADRGDAVVEERLDGGVERREHVLLGFARAGHLVLLQHVPFAIDEAGEDLRAPHVERDDDGSLHGGGYHNDPHGRGRQALPAVSRRPQEGQGPTLEHLAPPDAARTRAGSAEASAPLGAVGRARRRGRSSFWPFSGAPSGTARSRAAWTRRTRGSRRTRRRSSRSETARSSPSRRPSSSSARTAVAAPGRADANRSDSLLLLHLDPGTHRISYLSIPRDLRVEIPGYGSSKINAANQIGGPALTLATVKALTGLPIDHVVVVDFDGFEELIDAIGGIEVNVPKAILSNRFDCPYKPKRCADWEGWRFEKGVQHMDGRRALVYSRIRTNQLDPSDSDITRGNRQQIVADAVGNEIASFGTFLRLPFMGGELAAPLATDLSAWELAQLGWVRFRSGGSLRCRLGGEPTHDRRRVAAPRVRGQRRRDLDVARPYGAPRAAEGDALRRRLHAALSSRSRTPASA